MGRVKPIGCVDRRVEQLCLLAIQRVHLFQPTDRVDEPFGDEFDDIDSKGWGRVETRFIFNVILVTEHARHFFIRLGHQIIPDNHHGHACRAGIFLSARIEQSIASNIDRSGKKITRCIAHQRNAPRLRLFGKLNALDRFIGSKIYVESLGIEVEFIVCGNAVVI